MNTLNNLIQELYKYVNEQLSFPKPARIFLKKDSENAQNPLGKTGYYDPSGHKVVVYVTNRADKDICRSIAHELFHHHQNCNGQFPQNMQTEEGYAQKNEDLRELEREAYEKGNLLFRDWEDNYKKGQNNTMKKINERNELLNENLMKKWGFISEGKGFGSQGLYKPAQIREKPKYDAKELGFDLEALGIDDNEFQMGIRDEFEHTNDPKEAAKIAMDHLKMNKHYYTQMKKCGID